MESGQGENKKLDLTAQQCGPGCDCGKPAGNNKMKTAVFLLVVLSAFGIIVYKTAVAGGDRPVRADDAFSVELGEGDNTEAQKTWAGDPLGSLNSLNEKAQNYNTVFIFIPAREDGTVEKETAEPVRAVARTLESRGIAVGLYTLKTGTADYAKLTSKPTPPKVMVISKGGTAVMLAGELAETNLMQAYVASTRSGGCCSPGGGSSDCK